MLACTIRRRPIAKTAAAAIHPLVGIRAEDLRACCQSSCRVERNCALGSEFMGNYIFPRESKWLQLPRCRNSRQSFSPRSSARAAQETNLVPLLLVYDCQ